MSQKIKNKRKKVLDWMWITKTFHVFLWQSKFLIEFEHKYIKKMFVYENIKEGICRYWNLKRDLWDCFLTTLTSAFFKNRVN